jgi:CheY-like chemotaxis protein
MMFKVLIVGNDEARLQLLERLLRRRYQSTLITMEAALRRLSTEHFDGLLVAPTIKVEIAARLISQASEVSPNLRIVWLSEWQMPSADPGEEYKVMEMDYQFRNSKKAIHLVSGEWYKCSDVAKG